MTPEERAEVAPAADNFESLFGARDKKPLSVKAADVVVGMTPVGSAVEIGEELSKEDPSYTKIGVIAAGDVLGAAIPPAGLALKTLTGSGKGLVKDVDDLVDMWSKGDITNSELRTAAKELGVTIDTKRITKNRDASDIQIAMPDGKVYTGVDTIPNPDIDPEYVKGLTKDSDTDAIKELGLTEESLETWKAKNYAKDKYRIAPIEKLEEAAKALREGEITSAEFRELSDAYQPIIPIDEMPKFPTKEEVVQALYATDKRKVSKGIIGVNKTIQDGTPISARLDIPAYNDTDTWIVSLHDGTEKSGKTVGYAQTAVLNDVNFTTNPLAASSIAAGKGKTTIARMNGSYLNADPEEVYNTAKQILEANPEDWTQVGMNPYRASYFYDKADGMPVTSADQVIQVGPLVFAKNAKKTTPDDEMFEFTNKITGATANFNEGGMAIEDQMEMNFGDVPDNTIGVDPVSGNEIPLGSTAENVRDDIPAQLSEGEIVIPADVVRFHGVKLFEDLRAEAKLGFQQMNQDGRIGGQPIPTNDDEGLGIELADLEIIEVMDAPEAVTANKGAYTFDNITKKLVRKKAEDKPVFKNRAEEIIYNIRNFFGDDDDKPTKATDKPAIDFGFGGNPMERAARKYGSESTKTDNRSYRPSSTIEREAYKPKTNRPSLAEQMNFPGFDEGGDPTPRVVLEGKTGQILPEGYDPETDTIGVDGGLVEMREYQNAAGHTIMIPFIGGVPQTVIPEGYYPVGSAPVVVPTDGRDSGGSSDDDKPETPEPFNYKELTIDELTEEVKNLNATPLMGATTLFTGVLAFAQERHKRKTIEEIERRLKGDDPNNPNAELPIYEREYLENLLEVAKAPAKKGMIGKTIDKILGKEPEEEPDLPKLDGPTYDELPNQYSITESYKPETSATPTPNVTANLFSDKTIEAAKKASKEAAASITPPTATQKLRSDITDSAADKRQEARDRADDITRISQETGSSIAEVGRDIAPSDEKDDPDYGDPRRGMMNEGGLVDKPKVKEVVKGLEKASKSHAKQAAKLKKALGSKKKTKKSK